MNNKVLSNFIWKLLERIGAQGVNLVVSIILARILAPDAYGEIALISVFINILYVFVDSGLGTALVQKKDADNLDFSSVFYTNIAFCLLLYVLLFFSAPFIANFYSNQLLTPKIRVLGLTLVISGVKNIQCAYVSKEYQFKKFFIATSIGTVTAGILGIWMAFSGAGAWALVALELCNNAIDTVVLWIIVPWRPKLIFSLNRMARLCSYSIKLLFSSLLDTGYNNIRQLIIGKVYSSSDLAYFNKGKSWPNLVINNVNTSMNSVLLPVMSSAQDDVERVKAMTRRAMKTSIYVMAPLLMGLAFIGEPLIRLLLTEKWLPCVPYMTIFCITYMFYPLHTANLNAIKAMGRSDLFLKLEIVKKVMGLTVLALTMWHGVMAMAYSLLVMEVFGQIINSWPNKKLLNYGYLEQLKDIIPGILLAVIMGLCIYPIQWIGLPDVVTLLIQVPLGAVIYIGASALLKLESFTYLWGIVKPVIFKVLKRG